MHNGERLGIAVAIAALATGCHNRSPVRDVHAADPGVHVVNGTSTTAIVWSDGKGGRVCTLASGGKGKRGTRGHEYGARKHGHGQAPHPMTGAHPPIDSILFRLCEARGNGDLTQEQYVTILQTITAHAGTHPPRGFHGRGLGPREMRDQAPDTPEAPVGPGPGPVGGQNAPGPRRGPPGPPAGAGPR
jgi:hypothetical protein